MAYCSLDARTVNAMESLERIYTLLNGHEQDHFNGFIGSLVVNQASDSPVRLAWNPSSAVLLAALHSAGSMAKHKI